MMVALNIFPMIVNYLTTGSMSNRPVVIIESPESFNNYLKSIEGSTVYKFEFVSYEDMINGGEDSFKDQLKKGTLFVEFAGGDGDLTFDEAVKEYYSELINGNYDAVSTANITIGYNLESPGMELKAEQLEETIINPYEESLTEYIGNEYVGVDNNLITANSFNPIGKILDYRTSANRGASRVIPGVMLLLMYYCTYSLISDMFAMERERGFLNKLILTPVSRRSIFCGKLLATIGIVTTSALITFLMMFFSSWLNKSNDAMSLLPFGLFLTPYQLLLVVLEIIPAAFLMGVIAINIVFNTEKIQDTITCLQYPLILFLFDFFIQMFRGTRPMTLEMFVPLHGTLQILRNIFVSEDHFYHAVIPFAINTLLAIYILKKTLKKELSK